MFGPVSGKTFTLCVSLCREVIRNNFVPLPRLLKRLTMSGNRSFLSVHFFFIVAFLVCSVV